jgi:hypothetical protein
MNENQKPFIESWKIETTNIPAQGELAIYSKEYNETYILSYTLLDVKEGDTVGGNNV